MELIDVLSGSFCKAVRASQLVQTKLQMAEYSNVKFNRFCSQDCTEILTMGPEKNFNFFLPKIKNLESFPCLLFEK